MNPSVAREIKDARCAWLSEKATNVDELETLASQVFVTPCTWFRAFWRFLACIVAVRPRIVHFSNY